MRSRPPGTDSPSVDQAIRDRNSGDPFGIEVGCTGDRTDGVLLDRPVAVGGAVVTEASRTLCRRS